MSEIVRYATEEYVNSKIDSKTDELSTALGLLSTYTTLEDNEVYYDFNLDLLEKDKTYSLINNLTEDPNGGGPVKLFIGGVQKGVISIDSNCTYITIGIRSSTNTLYYNNLITSCSINLDTGEKKYEELYSLSRKAAKSEVLTLTNTTEYTPTTDYHPATKKYVDDNNFYAYPTILYDDANFPKGYVDITTLKTNTFYKVPKGVLTGIMDRVCLKAPNDDGTWFKVDDFSNCTGWRGFGGDTISLMTKSDTNITLYTLGVNGFAKCLSIQKENGKWSLKQTMPTILGTSNTAEYTPTTDYHPATKKYVDENGLTPTAKTLLATLLQNIPYSTDQSANVTAFLQELGVDTTQS